MYQSFTHKVAAKASWHRNYTTVTVCTDYAVALFDVQIWCRSSEWPELRRTRVATTSWWSWPTEDFDTRTSPSPWTEPTPAITTLTKVGCFVIRTVPAVDRKHVIFNFHVIMWLSPFPLHHRASTEALGWRRTSVCVLNVTEFIFWSNCFLGSPKSISYSRQRLNNWLLIRPR